MWKAKMELFENAGIATPMFTVHMLYPVFSVSYAEVAF